MAKYEVVVEEAIHHTVEVEANSREEAEEKARDVVIYTIQDGGSLDSELIKSHKIDNYYTVDVGCSVYESHELDGDNNNPKE